MGEKDSIIKNLRDANQRITFDLKDKNTIISRINSPSLTPHLRSPSQSFIGENFRHDEEVRMVTEQIERKTDEIARLKKERESRNKQYKDIEMEYETLQEENNKRRIETNNLKRQLVAIENLQLEVESLRSTLSKKNLEIGELKNSLFELDRLKMELDTAKREVEKQNEISRMKNRDLEHLTDRNFELEEKIRKKEFKVAQKVEPMVRNSFEEVSHLQEDSRRK